MGYKESQKKFLWLDPNRWSGQKEKKEKVWWEPEDQILNIYNFVIIENACSYLHTLTTAL